MLQEKINKFNELTLKAIKMVEEDKDITSIVEEREKILNYIKLENKDLKEYEMLVKELKLLENDKILRIKIEEERKKVREEIELLKKRKQMRNGYGNINKKVYFNKTI
ncbi:MAG: hypothetical protein ACRC30_05235 [Clostridium sp.]